MKTQSIGRSRAAPHFPRSRDRLRPRGAPPAPFDLGPYADASLQQYKTARENGEQADSPKNAFPSAGFEALKVKSSTFSAKGWPDAQNRYWWELTLEDGTTNEAIRCTHLISPKANPHTATQTFADLAA